MDQRLGKISKGWRRFVKHCDLVVAKILVFKKTSVDAPKALHPQIAHLICANRAH